MKRKLCILVFLTDALCLVTQACRLIKLTLLQALLLLIDATQNKTNRTVNIHIKTYYDHFQFA